MSVVERVVQRIDKKKVTDFINKYAILIILLTIIIYVGLTEENFISMRNFQNVARNASVRLLLAFGVSGCLITKGTDLSAGRLPALAGCIAATLLQRPDFFGRFYETLPKLPFFGEQWPIFFVLFISITVVAVFGLLNGIIIAYLKVPPFITTLGIQQVIHGICMIYTRNQNIGGFRQDYMDLASKSFMGIPYLFIITFFVGLIMWFLYNMTRHGKYMYAIGGNEIAAEVSGINVQLTLIKIYVLAAILYGLAGVLTVAKAGSASTGMTLGWELEAIAACTIGGVSTGGGVGKISGIVVGVMVFELMKNAINFMGINPNYQPIIIGTVIVIAVAFDIRNYLAKK